MMDDVLIANLPTELLRSALRVLVSQGSATQKPFVEHIRDQLMGRNPTSVDSKELFPEHNKVSYECCRYIALTRCVFSCKLAEKSLPYGVRWTRNSELEAALESFGGDIVQAVQALKESNPSPSNAIEKGLNSLIMALQYVRAYCNVVQPGPLVYPFTRADMQVRDVFALLYPEDATFQSGNLVSTISMDVSNRGTVETFSLGPYEMPRLFNGLWQLSSPAWGSATAEKQTAALKNLVEIGLTTADMADHYGDAELIYGSFRNRLPVSIKDQVYAATKWCIFKSIDQPVTTEWVLTAVRERCRRLGGRVELLQFHWFDYEAKEYLEILVELVRLTKSHTELVSAIGLCNFDSRHTEEACEYILEKTGSVGLVSNQVQFSLFDARPLQKMCAVCLKYGLKLLTYGSFCGGFLSDKWHGQPVPEIYSEASHLTPSQRKYFDVISNWGTWSEFQMVLDVLDSIAKKHHVSLTDVSTRWVLQQPAVGAVIVGTRLGVSAHDGENVKVFGFSLDDDDVNKIKSVVLGSDMQRANVVFEKLGDCGNEYRAMH